MWQWSKHISFRLLFFFLTAEAQMCLRVRNLWICGSRLQWKFVSSEWQYSAWPAERPTIVPCEMQLSSALLRVWKTHKKYIGRSLSLWQGRLSAGKTGCLSFPLFLSHTHKASPAFKAQCWSFLQPVAAASTHAVTAVGLDDLILDLNNSRDILWSI